DIYRHQMRRDVILMSAADMAQRGLKEDDRVVVRSSAGALHNVLVREFDIRAGNAAMYYPEANVLVPAAVDERSRTPAYKNVAVTVSLERPADASQSPPPGSNGTADPQPASKQAAHPP